MLGHIDEWFYHDLPDPNDGVAALPACNHQTSVCWWHHLVNASYNSVRE